MNLQPLQLNMHEFDNILPLFTTDSIFNLELIKNIFNISYVEQDSNSIDFFVKRNRYMVENKLIISVFGKETIYGKYISNYLDIMDYNSWFRINFLQYNATCVVLIY